jgi:hypothetical protein
MIASVFITLWELLTKCLTVTFVKHSSEDQQWLPTDFITSQ